MQHTDKATAAFEAWWDRQPFRELFKDVKDQMRNVWMASKVDTVVVLPEKITKAAGYTDDDEFYNLAIDHCRAAIEAAGVTVKE